MGVNKDSPEASLEGFGTSIYTRLHTVSHVEQLESQRHYEYRGKKETTGAVYLLHCPLNEECEVELSNHIHAISIHRFEVGYADNRWEEEGLLMVTCGEHGISFPEESTWESEEDFKKYGGLNTRAKGWPARPIFPTETFTREDGKVVVRGLGLPVEEPCGFCDGKMVKVSASTAGGAGNLWTIVTYCLNCSRIDQMEAHYEWYARSVPSETHPNLIETEGYEHEWSIYRFHYDETEKAATEMSVERKEKLKRVIRNVLIPVEVEP